MEAAAATTTATTAAAAPPTVHIAAATTEKHPTPRLRRVEASMAPISIPTQTTAAAATPKNHKITFTSKPTRQGLPNMETEIFTALPNHTYTHTETPI